VLKPLVDLAGDESLAGMARGIAFRLVENLGILDRREVLEEVRGLDQEARGSLRRHGVRFGAYHIYFPALLKPAASSLLAQLWELGQAEAEPQGLPEMAAVSASGRTSVDVDPAIAPELYRRFGFRIYGARAVRIDILERVADLIRPALAWRPGVGGERPAGAVEGGGFTVTPAMTSLLGASGEAMGVILRGLGYRSEVRPKPAEPPPAAEADNSAAVQPGEAPAPNGPPVEEPPVTEPTIEPPGEEPPSPPPLEEPPREEPVPQPPPQEEPPVEEPVVPPNAAAEPTDGEVAAPAEPPTIEVWRPARQGQRRQPARGRQASRREGAPGKQAGDKQRPRKPGAPPRRHEAKKPDRRPQAESERPRRDKPIDPDSPFAALASLKKDLEKAGK
jgi:ATP-dependent RNA helicase SUPV3L1/SUV3